MTTTTLYALLSNKIANLSILSFDPGSEVVHKEVIQAKILHHNEYTLLSMLADLDGVINERGFFSDYAFEEREQEQPDGSWVTIYTGRVRRRLTLVLDCVHAHEFCDRSGDFVTLQNYIPTVRGHEFEGLQIFYEVVRVVEQIHDRNVVHRDLKLNNIVLNRRTKRVVLTNFFLGKHLINGNELLYDQRGSPAYISPDVLAGKPYRGKPSDIWALGVILYTLIYGRYPFLDNTPAGLFRKIREVDFTIPSVPKMSESTNILIKAMLVHNPDDRFTATEVRVQLEQILRSMAPARTKSDQLVPEFAERSAGRAAGDHAPPDTPALTGAPEVKRLASPPKHELSTEPFSRILEQSARDTVPIGGNTAAAAAAADQRREGEAAYVEPKPMAVQRMNATLRLIPPGPGQSPFAPIVSPAVQSSSALELLQLASCGSSPPAAAGGRGQRNRLNFDHVPARFRPYTIPAAGRGAGGTLTILHGGPGRRTAGSAESNSSSNERSHFYQTMHLLGQWPINFPPASVPPLRSVSNANESPTATARTQPSESLMALVAAIRSIYAILSERARKGRGVTVAGTGQAAEVDATLDFTGIVTPEMADKIVSFLIVHVRHHEVVTAVFGNAGSNGRDVENRVHSLLELLRQLGVRMEADGGGRIVIRPEQTRERLMLLVCLLRIAGYNDGYFKPT
ncbi:serine/threonine-protein kinase pkn6-like [Anopheles cruzii]|uniref:serine/threonine-protein kinase pkn6-like n=1 Tax=Anopheles cruzii TaxID=68878 RepID=UPI0022EC7C04|nr:serine/threonine-protein kinase pkn6-like [Anopheles cruzii]